MTDASAACPRRKVRPKLRQRIITGIIFTVLVLSLFVPALFWPVTGIIMAAAIGVFACIEIYRALKHGGYRPSRVLLIIGMVLATLVVLCGLLFQLNIESVMALYLIIVCMYSLACGINLPLVRPDDEKSFLNGLFTGGMVFYISFPLFCLVSALLFVPNGWFYMVIGLFAPWGTDVFAYFTGVAIGKHKIVPHISPKKTWEGCIGGTVCSVIKRRTGIKDFGNIFPGHGGMMDRFDSAFFTLPTALLLAIIANNLF